MTKVAKKLKAPIFKQLYIRADQARAAGVHPALLSYYEKKGLLQRLERGLYLNRQVENETDFQWEDLVQTVKGLPNGIVTGITALVLYGLTDETPRLHWISVPHQTSLSKRLNTKIIRTRNHELGRSTIKIGETEIPIYDLERTLVDAFRILSFEAAIKALKSAFSRQGKGKPDIKKISKYAKELHTNIDDYLLAVTA